MREKNFSLVGRNGINKQKFQKTHLNSTEGRTFKQASLFKTEWVAPSPLHVIRKGPEDIYLGTL